jgi:hypothetical protein
VANLRAALLAYGEPRVPVRVDVREVRLVVLHAQVAVDADRRFDLVEPQVRSALLARLGFDARELAQPVYVSEILACAMAVPGVDHVTVKVLSTVSFDDVLTDLSKVLTDLSKVLTDLSEPAASRTVEDLSAHRPAPVVTPSVRFTPLSC